MEICGGLRLLHSTREELRAILSAEILIDTCNEVFGTGNTNHMEFICDSRSALGSVQLDVAQLKLAIPLKADMEIILEIDRLRRKNDTVNRSYKWVKSHQNKKELNADERLNARADQLATEGREDTGQALINIESNNSTKGLWLSYISVALLLMKIIRGDSGRPLCR